MSPIDRSIVLEGYPSESGLHLLWSSEGGWPVIAIVRVDIADGRASYWKGTGGTDRISEMRQMFGVWRDGYVGHSRITQQALEHYESVWQEASLEVRGMLAERDALDASR